MPAEDRLNTLNAGLMLASCVAAFVFPFELFLLAYAVLGPLHYLTEISWIHDRRYFLHREESLWSKPLIRAWLGLVGLALVVMIYGIYQERVAQDPVSPVWEIGLFYLVFVVAALAIFRSHPLIAAAAIVLTGVGAALFNGSPYYGLVAFLIITIIHVLVFTAAFVLLGALKNRSRSGLISLAVFVLCAASFFVIVPGASAVGEYVHRSYEPFELLNVQLIRAFGLGAGTALREAYESRGGAIVMRLIAFAYTYHYLNWFTKTSVIGWHRISGTRAWAILLLWLGALAVYAYSYVLGFVVLYSLSVLHVMLELPLNHQSFAGIGKELAGLARRRQVAAN
jgi:hypothetical protein